MRRGDGSRRVVVSGAGVVSALGFSSAELWENLLRGASAARLMTEWPEFTPDQVLAAPVELDQAQVRRIDRKYRRSMGNLSLYSVLAADQAVTESGLDRSTFSSGRVGCMISSTMGSGRAIEEAVNIWNSPERKLMPALQFFKGISHTTAMNVANYMGINGIQLSPCSACASALQSIGSAYEAIRFGRQDVVLAGGAEELTPMVVGFFEQLFALAGSGVFAPEAISRPFDAARCGLVCGEGAGILVLEEYEHAMRRGAPILFEVAGYATNCSGAHVSQSERDAITACIRLAMADAEMTPERVDYVSAHATATLQGDGEEAAALLSIFGDRVPVSSLKGHLGHTLGASGAIELAACGGMLEHDMLLPTLNLENVADDCTGLRHLRENTPARIEVFLKSCFAFGGINAVLLGKRI